MLTREHAIELRDGAATGALGLGADRGEDSRGRSGVSSQFDV